MVTPIDATITKPNTLPTTTGKHEITFGNVADNSGAIVAGKTTGKFDLYILGQPQIKATKVGDGTYTSAEKTNKNVTITAQAIAGLELEYRVSGGAWQAYPATGVKAETTSSLYETYQFRYKEITNLDGYSNSPATEALMDTALSSSMTVDINKVMPELMNNSTNKAVTNGAVYADPFNATAKANISGDNVTVVATRAGVALSYTDNMKLYGAEYEFKLTDGYGNTKTLKFNFAKLTVSVSNKTVTYNGASHGLEATANKAGSTIWYSTAENGTYTTSAIKYDDVKNGGYTIWVKATNNNYPTSDPVSATLTINPKPVTFKPVDISTTYSGVGVKATDVVVTAGGLATVDEVNKTGTVLEGILTEAGITDSSIKTIKIKRTSGGKDVTNNYTISTEKGYIEIYPKGGLGVIVTPASVTYDDKAHGITEVKASDDDATILYSTDEGVTWVDKTPTYTEAKTYNLKVKATKKSHVDSLVKDTSVKINKRNVTITADNETKVYDGKALSTKSHKITTGTLADGTHTVKATYGGIITNKGTTSAIISDYAVMKGNVDKSSNYTVTAKTGTLTVTARPMTITPNSDKKVYDGTPLVSTSRTVIGLVTGEALKVTYGGMVVDKGTTNSSIAEYATNKSGTDTTSNYQVDKKTGTLEITAKQVTLTAIGAKKVYDGKELATTSHQALGLVAGENLAVTYGDSIIDKGSKSSTIKTYVMTDPSRANKVTTNNYSVAKKDSTLEITARQVTITAIGGSKVYDGSPLATTSHQAVGLVAGENLAVTYGDSITNKGSKASTIKTYVMTDPSRANKDTTNNYSTATEDSVLQITARPLTVTPVGGSKIYDGTALVSNDKVIGGQGLAATDNLTATYSGSQKNVGKATAGIDTLAITNGSGQNALDNYSISRGTAELSVTERPVTIVPVDAEKTYDGKALKATSVKVHSSSKYKMVSGEKLTDPKFSDTRTAVGSTKITVLSVKVNGGSSSNYDFTSAKGTLTVKEATGNGGGDNTGGGTGGTDGTTNTGGTSNPTNDTGNVAGQIQPPTDTIEPGSSTETDTIQGTNREPITSINDSPSLNIGNTEIPLWGSSDFPSWSLLNMILTIGSAFMMLMMIIPIYLRKREEDTLAAQGYERRKTFNGKWALAGLAFFVAQLVVLLLTQSINATMVVADMWTVVHLLGTILVVVSVLFTLKTKDSTSDFGTN